MSGAWRERVRPVARHIALDGLSLAERASRRSDRDLATPRVHFVYLHAVPPETLSRFERLVSWLSRGADLVSHDRAVELLDSESLTRPAISFSFDDGFVSNLDAATVLERHGAVGTFFVPTGFVGIADVQSARAFYGIAAGVDERAMTWGELEGLHARGHIIANHTITHRVLSSLSEAEAAEEIEGARGELVSRFGECDHFAWPRGQFMHMTAAAANKVFESGHRSNASAERGSHLPGSGAERVCLRRDHLMSEWPLRHDLHFVAKSARQPGKGSWPAGWSV